jgi:hypothetical protein
VLHINWQCCEDTGIEFFHIEGGICVRWEEVLLDDEIQRGDFELHTYDRTFRGPITTLTVHNGLMRVIMKWCAYKFDTGNDSLAGPWYEWPRTIGWFRVDGSIPTKVGMNIVFGIRLDCHGVLIPRDGSTLQRARVRQQKRLAVRRRR